MNNIDIDVICWGYFLSFIFCSKDFVFLPDLNCVFFLEKYTIGEDFMYIVISGRSVGVFRSFFRVECLLGEVQKFRLIRK